MKTLGNMIALSMCLTFTGIASAATLHVDPEDGLDNRTGLSWELAVQTLTRAIELAAAGDMIKVAGGTYSPGDNEEDTFLIDGDDLLGNLVIEG